MFPVFITHDEVAQRLPGTPNQTPKRIFEPGLLCSELRNERKELFFHSLNAAQNQVDLANCSSRKARKLLSGRNISKMCLLEL